VYVVRRTPEAILRHHPKVLSDTNPTDLKRPELAKPGEAKLYQTHIFQGEYQGYIA